MSFRRPFKILSIVLQSSAKKMLERYIFLAITSAKVQNFDFSTWTASYGDSDFHTESAWENFVALNRGTIELSDEV